MTNPTPLDTAREALATRLREAAQRKRDGYTVWWWREIGAAPIENILDQAAAALVPEAKQEDTRTAWLIENSDTRAGVNYLALGKIVLGYWTHIIDQATQFARAKDARDWLASQEVVDPTKVSVIEHIWPEAKQEGGGDPLDYESVPPSIRRAYAYVTKREAVQPLPMPDEPSADQAPSQGDGYRVVEKLCGAGGDRYVHAHGQSGRYLARLVDEALTAARRAIQKALAEEQARTGLSQSDIARTIGVHRSVINREIHPFTGPIVPPYLPRERSGTVRR